MKKIYGLIVLLIMAFFVSGLAAGAVSAAGLIPDLELDIVKAPNYQSPSCTITGSTTTSPGGIMNSAGINYAAGIDHASHHRSQSAPPQISDEARKTEMVNQLAGSTMQITELLKTIDEMTKNKN